MKFIENINDIIVGEIYRYHYPDNDITIFRANESLRYSTSISNWKISSSKFNKSFYIKNNNEDVKRIQPATQDEKDWFEYCELHDKYFEKEYALKHLEKRMLREFIQEYLTEE